MKWIWIRDNSSEEVNQYVNFTDTFDLTSFDAAHGADYFCRISADSQYALWINDVFVNCGQYADFPHYKVYDTINITSFVKPGINKFFLLVYYQGTNSSTYVHGRAGVAFDVVQRFADGDDVILESSERTLCSQSSAYRSGGMEMVSGQLGYAFEYNASAINTPVWQPSVAAPLYILLSDSDTPPSSFSEADAITSDNSPDESSESASIYEDLVLYMRPIDKLVIEQPKDARVVSQGVFKYIPSEFNAPSAVRMQHAFLSFRMIREISAPALPNNPILSCNAEPMHFTVNNNDCDADGLYIVVDLGSEEAGYFHIDIDAPANTEILIAYGEHLDDLRVRSSIGGRCFSGRYICRGGGREVFTHYNKRLGCRYLQLYIKSFDFTLYYAGIRTANYPVADLGNFECCDSLHNKIHEISRRTLLMCMHEHYEDCPWREQALYAMDSRNQLLCGFYAFGEYRFPKSSIRLLAKSQREDGLLELCAPAKVGVTIPSFSLMWIVELYEYVLYSGDIAFAAECFPTAARIIRSFWMKAHGSDILLSWSEHGYWNFYEWEEWLSGSNTPDCFRNSDCSLNYDAPLTLFYMLALHAATRMAKWLDKSHEPDDTTDYQELASWYDMLRNNAADIFHDIFWDEETGAYASYVINGARVHFGELTNSLAIVADVVPSEFKERIADVLCSKETLSFGAFPSVYTGSNGNETEISDDDAASAQKAYDASPKRLVPVTLSHTVFKYEALLSVGEAYSDYVLKDIADKWGYMLYHDSTTFWETLDGAWAFDNAGSLCHGWSAVPLLVYYKYILGVTPTSPGFEDYSFHPMRSPIIKADGVIPMPDGSKLSISIRPEGFEINKE